MKKWHHFGFFQLSEAWKISQAGYFLLVVPPFDAQNLTAS
jgi:hypothetical protein